MGHGKPFSDEDITFLRLHYPKYTIPEISKALDRPISSIQHKLGELGIKKIRRFTNGEIEYLKANYPDKKTATEISKKLGTTVHAVIYQLVKLGIRAKEFITEDEANYIKDNYMYLTVKQMSQHLGRPFGGIKQFMQRNKLTVGREKTNIKINKVLQNKVKEKESSKYLICKHCTKTKPIEDFIAIYGANKSLGKRHICICKECARKRGRNWHRKKFNVKESNYHEKYTDFEIDYIKNNYKTKSRSIMADELHIKDERVSMIMQKFNLRRPITKNVKSKLGQMSQEGRKRQLAAVTGKTRYKDFDIVEWKVTQNMRMKFIRLPNKQHWNRWKLLHIYNWEKVHGKVPHNKTLAFIDGNEMNCDYTNLRLVDLQSWIGHTKLSDRWVVRQIKGVDSNLADYLILHYPELIELKRQNIKTQREIKNKRLNENP